MFLTNCVLMLDWIIWNRTICIKIDLALNNLQRFIRYKTQPINPLGKYIFLSLYIRLREAWNLIFFKLIICLWFELVTISIYSNLEGKNFFELFWVLILQIFRSKSHIVCQWILKEILKQAWNFRLIDKCAKIQIQKLHSIFIKKNNTFSAREISLFHIHILQYYHEKR